MAKDKNGRELPKGITWRKDKDIYMIRFTYQGTPYTFYEKSLSEAKKTLKDKRYEVEHGLAGKANRITLNQWFETWFTTYKLKTVKESTAETYFKVYNNHIRETIGSKRLDQIKSVHIQKLYNELSEQNLSATYISNIGAVLHNIFDIAVKNDLLPKNPCIGAIKPKAEQKEPRCLSMKEQETLLSYLKQDKWKQHEPLITFLLNTGMRIGEALGLKWDDVDFEKHEIRIERTIFYRKNTEMHKERYVFQTPKTEKSRRTIILPQNAEKALHRQKLYQNQMKLYNGSNWKPLDGFDGLVFTTEKGTPILSNTVNRIIDRLINQINADEARLAEKEGRKPVLMEHFHPHSLRHTFITRCFEAGIPPKTVQTIIGHSDCALTMNLYTHVTESKMREDVEKLDDFFQKGS